MNVYTWHVWVYWRMKGLFIFILYFIILINFIFSPLLTKIAQIIYLRRKSTACIKYVYIETF